MQALPSGERRPGPHHPLPPAAGDAAPALPPASRPGGAGRSGRAAPDHRGREEGAQGRPGGAGVPGDRRALDLARRRPADRRPRSDRLVRPRDADRPGLGRVDPPGPAAAGLRARQGAGGARREGRGREVALRRRRREGRARRLPLRGHGRRLRRAAEVRAEARGVRPDERLVARLGEARPGRRRRQRADRARAARTARVGPGAPPGPGCRRRRAVVRTCPSTAHW